MTGEQGEYNSSQTPPVGGLCNLSIMRTSSAVPGLIQSLGTYSEYSELDKMRGERLAKRSHGMQLAEPLLTVVGYNAL